MKHMIIKGNNKEICVNKLRTESTNKIINLSIAVDDNGRYR